jgi:hypothetical protein
VRRRLGWPTRRGYVWGFWSRRSNIFIYPPAGVFVTV